VMRCFAGSKGNNAAKAALSLRRADRRVRIPRGPAGP
jgi:hypothetical protein